MKWQENSRVCHNCNSVVFCSLVLKLLHSSLALLNTNYKRLSILFHPSNCIFGQIILRHSLSQKKKNDATIFKFPSILISFPIRTAKNCLVLSRFKQDFQEKPQWFGKKSWKFLMIFCHKNHNCLVFLR